MSDERDEQLANGDRDADGTTAGARERERAARLAEAVDAFTAGEVSPAAEDVAPAAAAARMIHAAFHEHGLPRQRRDDLVAAALQAEATTARSAAWRKPLLAVVAALLLALAAVLATVPWRAGQRRPRTATLPSRTRSRPSDGLLGAPIAPDRRGAASRRLDRVYADRLAGYRIARLGSWRGVP